MQTGYPDMNTLTRGLELLQTNNLAALPAITYTDEGAGGRAGVADGHRESREGHVGG